MRLDKLKSKPIIIGIIVIVILVFLFFNISSKSSKSVGNLTETKVSRIVDGDTIHCDAFSENIRIIGVNCPETGTSDGEKATSYTKSVLKVGQKVWLEKDTSETDTHNRPLRYVWLEKPSDKVTKDDVMNKTLEGKLLTSKHGSVMTVKPNVKYSEWFASQ